ncbi:MAG: hypothetical protein HUJ70_04355, partial [Pseudobutyrivibrio sp.]|nr:hypothetical protein [Pseudobutyrivibrio sp.]
VEIKPAAEVFIPNGNYTLKVEPKALCSVTGNVIKLAEISTAIAVTSNRTMANYGTTTLTANTYAYNTATAPITIKDGSEIDRVLISLKSVPNVKSMTKQQVFEKAYSEIQVDFAKDPSTKVVNLQAKAQRGALTGSYVYTVQPVIILGDGTKVLLDSKDITVKVDATKPKAGLSGATVSLNENYRSYNPMIIVKSNTEGASFTFDETDIVSADTKVATKAMGEKLISCMSVVSLPTGESQITVALPDGDTVSAGTYKFAFVPTMISGNNLEAADEYELPKLTFSVKVETAMPKVTAKVTGKIDLVKRDTSCADVVLSVNSQPYEYLRHINNVEPVVVYSDGREEADSRFSTTLDGANVKVYVDPDAEFTSTKYRTWLRVSTTTDQGQSKQYLVPVDITTMQSAVSVKATQVATLYEDLGTVSIPVKKIVENIDEQKVRYILNMIRDGREDHITELSSDVVCITAK